MNPGSKADSCVLYHAANQQWLYFESPTKILSTYCVDSVVELLERAESLVKSEGYYAVGFLAYGAAPAFDPSLVVQSSQSLPLLWFGLYENPKIIDLPRIASASCKSLMWVSDLDDLGYEQALGKIKYYLAAGDTYQTNYTYRLHAEFDLNPWDYFRQMIQAQGNGYGTFINTDDWALCSASPELLFERNGEALVSIPMKGTVGRGLYYQDDLDKRDWLQNSEKNRAENLMIVDMVRNDLSHIANVGSVKADLLFQVKQYPTVWQMLSTLSCITSVKTSDVFRALFPAASITGAPKIRTMNIIAELEHTARELYTGSVGFIAPNNVAQFNVAIRSVVVDKCNGRASYGVGGGIVWDSDIDEELNESQLKAKILNYRLPDFKLIESLLWTREEEYFLLAAHMQRLSQSAEYFSYAVDIEKIQAELASCASRLSAGAYKVRLLVAQDARFSIEADALEPLPENYTLVLANTPVCAHEDRFLYHKTSLRQVYDQAMAEKQGANDVLLWNEHNQITESCIANIVVELDGQLVTPTVHCGLLPGVYRQNLLESGAIQEAYITVDDVKRSNSVYLINSVRKMWPVNLVT